jgi:hypothetical protein
LLRGNKTQYIYITYKNKNKTYMMTVPHRILPTTFNNVNRNTFDDMYESILDLVRKAFYNTLDTEFTGLGEGRR